MKITYDKEMDALYIRLLEGKHQCHSIRLSDDITLNIGKKEKLVGIEILDASRMLGKNGKLSEIMIENLTFADVSEKLKLPKANYAEQSHIKSQQAREPKVKYKLKN